MTQQVVDFPIQSFTDTDLYKLSMQRAALELFSDAECEIRFINRGKHKFNEKFFALFKAGLKYGFPLLKLTENERTHLESLGFFNTPYLDYLQNYRFNPDAVKADLVGDDLQITIKGNWSREMLWEVPLMAFISQLYFETVDTNWSMEGQEEKIREKIKKFQNAGAVLVLAEFGTRRRRNFATQDLIVRELMNYPRFIGTSNVHLAREYGVKAIGTMAHEFVQANAVLESMNHPNYYMLQNWVKVYNADLGIALTDTYTTDAFLKNFNLRFAKLYDGVRHDSGDPFVFTDKIVAHYKNLGIDPMSKVIIFSDGLDIEKALKILQYCSGKIKCAFGIGTYMTNDFDGSKALNMVIKLWSVNGVPCPKLSDTPGKTSGDADAIRVFNYIHRGIALNKGA